MARCARAARGRASIETGRVVACPNTHRDAVALSASPTDILYVITDLEVGGVPLHLRRLAVAMRDRGLTPSVVSLAPPGPVADMLAADGVEVASCHGCCGVDVRVVSRLADIIRRTNPTIVHALLFHANLAARLAALHVELPRERLLCEIQTVEIERRWHLLVDRWTHRLCRLTIGNSPSVVEHLADQAGIPRRRLHLIRGGIDPAPYRDATPIDRSALGLPGNAPIILWVGRLDPVKGLDFLLGAFKLVSAQVPGHLILAGDGPMREHLAVLVDRLELGDRVHLLGARRDVPRLLKAADLFVFPSRTEGLPNALLEARAAECPIVTTDVPGCRDLIQDGTTGLLVPYGQADALADAIRRLLTEPETARRLSQSAAQEVTRHWHLDSSHDAYARLYAAVGTTRTGTLMKTERPPGADADV